MEKSEEGRVVKERTGMKESNEAHETNLKERTNNREQERMEQ